MENLDLVSDSAENFDMTMKNGMIDKFDVE